MVKKVLILGGGFGGVFTAKKLIKQKSIQLDIELISNNNYFIFQPLLPEVASGTISESDAVTPLRELLKGIKFRHAEVSKIDVNNRTVSVVQGYRKRSHLLKFDHLVVALGQESNLDIVPGLRDHSFTIRNLKDAYNLRNHIISCLELADVTEDLTLKNRLLKFVVVGGGFSGVETIGEIKEMVDRLLIYYPNICNKDLSFYIVESSNRLLPELTPSISKYISKVFLEEKIKIYSRTKLKEITGTSVYLENGETIPSGTTISTIGSVVSKLIKNSSLPLDRGKIITNEFLQVSKLNNVWALGDSALVKNKISKKIAAFAPPTAQFAVREAKLVAKNILAFEKKEKLNTFSYKSLGSLASLGSRKGVGKILFFTIKGFSAWLIWRLFYLSFLPSFSTKARILFSWILELLVPRNAVMTAPFKTNSVKYQYYKKDDVVFEEGMVADGFYIVIRGLFKNTYKKTKSGTDYTKLYKKGEHFGSRAILSGIRRTGTIIALKDSKVLRVDRESFQLLSKDFEVLRNYFDKYLDRNFEKLDLINEEILPKKK